MLEKSILIARTDQGVADKLVLSSRGDGGLLIQRVVIAQFPCISKAEMKRIGDFWYSPKTVCYAGVEFNPRGASPNYLNLWVGPTVIDKAGRWGLIAEFLQVVICNGDDVSFQYLIRYIAHALQCPWEKPGILIVMLGGQGTGKGTVGTILRKIWRATYLQVHNIDAVTGNFNAALERAYIVFMDEALFVGDRRASDALKSLVTEPIIHINAKHQPSRQTKSYHRFFAATNAEHFKHTERDDRRDFILRVSESRKGDHAYWQALNHEMDNGGVEAFVHDLLAMDLSEFNVRSKPNTKALLVQKLQSLGPTAEWWFQTLCDGTAEDDKWPSFISTKTCIEKICEMFGNKMFKRPTQMSFSSDLKKLCPGANNAQKKGDGQFDLRVRGYTLPSLAEARAEFEAYIGDDIAWEQWNA